MDGIHNSIASQIQPRWMIRRDLPEVLDCDHLAFPNDPWCEEDYLKRLRIMNAIGFVADFNESIIGSMVYELQKDRLRLLRLSIHPAFQRRQAGRRMVEVLKTKIVQQKRQELCCEVRESNLDAQLFFRACGLSAVDNIRGWFDDTGEDAIVFSYQIQLERRR